MKKVILLLLVLISSFIIQAQEKTVYAVGDDVEYFDGLNWIDSKIVQVGQNGQYMVYLNHNESQTKWFKSDDIQPLFKTDQKIVQTKVEIIETVVTPLFHVADIVKYNNGTSWVQTSIMQIGPNYTYQIYTDTNKVGTIWRNEADLQLIKSNYDAVAITQSLSKIEYKINQEVEYYYDGAWKKGKIEQISLGGDYKFPTLGKWFSYEEIRTIQAGNETQSTNTSFEVGTIVKVFNGSIWLESEILQVGDNGQYQVYYNLEKTSTKWLDGKDLKK